MERDKQVDGFVVVASMTESLSLELVPVVSFAGWVNKKFVWRSVDSAKHEQEDRPSADNRKEHTGEAVLGVFPPLHNGTFVEKSKFPQSSVGSFS